MRSALPTPDLPPVPPPVGGPRPPAPPTPNQRPRSPQASANPVSSFTPGGAASGLTKEAKRGLAVFAGVVLLGIVGGVWAIQSFVSSNKFVTSLEEGECITDYFTEDEEGFVYVLLVPVTDCGNPHAMEVYSVNPDAYFGDDYPGLDEAYAIGEEWCDGQFRTFVGEPYEQSPLEMWTFVPNAFNWDDGDRSVQCIVGHFDRVTLVTGTLRDSAGRSST